MKSSENDTNFDNNSEVSDLFKRELIPLVYRHIQASYFDEALRAIEDFYNLNLEKDEQGWLENKCNFWKALILEKQEKYSEALPLYRAAHRSIQQNDNLFVYKKLDIARVLHKLGNNDEAIREIEHILEQSVYDSPLELLKLLKCYTDCLESSGRNFPVEYKELITRLGNEFSANLSNSSQLKLQDIKEAIEQIAQENTEANRRYSLFMIQLDRVEARSEKIHLLRDYISEERINCYRNLAIEQLDEIES